MLLVLVMAVLGIHENTNASIIDGGTSYYATPSWQTFYDAFDGTTAIADIQCNVYTYESGAYANQYAYTYQITNTSDVDLSFVVFSAQIFNGVEIGDSGIEGTGLDDVIPSVWDPVGSPTHSFNGHFDETIFSGEQSALLWFVSDYAPTDAGEGFLMGTYMPAGGTEWVGVYAEGNLIVPSTVVPEPTTIALLALGGLMLRRRRGCGSL